MCDVFFILYNGVPTVVHSQSVVDNLVEAARLFRVDIHVECIRDFEEEITRLNRSERNPYDEQKLRYLQSLL